MTVTTGMPGSSEKMTEEPELLCPDELETAGKDTLDTAAEPGLSEVTDTCAVLPEEPEAELDPMDDKELDEAREIFCDELAGEVRAVLCTDAVEIDEKPPDKVDDTVLESPVVLDSQFVLMGGLTPCPFLYAQSNPTFSRGRAPCSFR